MSKIRVLHKAPVLNDLGVILSVVELAGPSSESKPTTGIANGSLFRETDTGKIFIFDEDDGWSETGSGGGGGSGLPDTPGTDGTYSLQNTVESGTGTLSWASGGGGGALVVNLTIDTGTKTATADKTAAEIWAAAQSGGVLFTGSNAYSGQDGTFVRPIMEAIHNEFGYVFMFGGAFDALDAATGSDYPTGTLN